MRRFCFLKRLCIYRQNLHILTLKGGVMDDKFLCGIVLGMMGGALIATNSAKARQIVKDGQEQVKQKVEDMTKTTKNKD